jgi:hypothetical protein
MKEQTMGTREIFLRREEINMCKLLAVAGLEEERAEAEAKGEPFDYEAIKAEREKEFILLYAEQKREKGE